ncbi:hypothetical protein I7I53_11752 [Histoplasma capsulatum var. duboisii H88]|uniref:Uncharacterized protein n=1 Tax=Ajellomyces capsulatus (strain H88) TaxID=544711 RepID=A0A8A1LZF0_AJEC8|nr:hypothetical protein I7I53_11752 [Histoplasma capsulatum var. duboisii H88]
MITSRSSRPQSTSMSNKMAMSARNRQRLPPTFSSVCLLAQSGNLGIERGDNDRVSLLRSLLSCVGEQEKKKRQNAKSLYDLLSIILWVGY